MTLHIFYNHACPACEAYFIPYAAEAACPQCGRLPEESEVFAYIPQAAGSVDFNLRSYGSYLPPAWYMGSLGDHVLYVLFGLFEAHRKAGRPADFSEFTALYLNRMKWGDQLYLRDHIGAIARAVQPLLRTPHDDDPPSQDA